MFLVLPSMFLSIAHYIISKTPFKPNPLVKKPGPRSSSNGEDGTASHEAKPDALLSSNFWWSCSHIPGEWFPRLVVSEKSHALVTHNLHTYKFLKTVSHISYQKRNHGDISFSTINKKNTNTKTGKCRVIFSCHPSTWSWVKSFCGCSGGVVWWVGEVVLLCGVVPGHLAPCLVLQGVARIAGFSFRTLLQW